MKIIYICMYMLQYSKVTKKNAINLIKRRDYSEV
jgi:hypothetical protein